MAKHGSLFILHLLREGIILCDGRGELESVLNSYVEPEKYDYFFRELRSAIPLIDCDLQTYRSNWGRYNRVAIFLLRSTMFSMCAAQREPLFSISRIAQKFGDSRISRCYALKYEERPDYDLFRACGLVAAQYLQTEVHNPSGNIESLLVASGGASKLLRALGLRLVEADSDEEFYNADALRDEDMVCPLP